MSGVNVGMFGLGNMGLAVAYYLNELYNEEKTDYEINLKKVAVKNLKKPRKVKFDKEKITDDRRAILDDPDIDIVVELIGGYEPARTIILESLKSGKDVVTANKAVLAKYGMEIFNACNKYKRNIGFQASVCGEMRILGYLSQIPSYDELEALVGILNGTSNFILTQMNNGKTYEEALKKAQSPEMGLAEPNPSFDVKGIDASQKLALLASIAFGTPVDFEQIYTEGIDTITDVDIEFAREWDYVIKPLAIVKKQKNGLELRVHPAFVPKSDPLSTVNYELNALSIYFVGRKEPITIQGKGAGKDTARSIVADIVEVAKNRKHSVVDIPPIHHYTKKEIIDPEEYETEFYLRFLGHHIPGVLGGITTALGDYKINISYCVQPKKKFEEGRVAPIAVFTESVKGRNIYAALRQIEKLHKVTDPLPIRIFT